MTTITITFERMPGFPTTEVVMIFKRVDRAVSVKVITSDVREGSATCHPKDEFSLEFGMRLAVKRARNDSDGYWRPRSKSGMFYRAFRRWMWLAKAQNKCGIELGTGCSQYCDLYAICGLDRPAGHIASEYGKVTVEGDIPEELAWMKSVEVKE